MMQLLLVFAGLLGLAAAAPRRVSVEGRAKLTSYNYGCNTPSNRACWTKGFDLNTDYETKIPSTGITRIFNFEITEVDNYVSGDGGIKKKAMLVNGQFPGPTIEADWGDDIEVRVTNHLRLNGTGLHWHGIRQLNNNVNDGTNGVTECPIPPGSTKTYRFRAEQYGTSWYHSHFSSQYANGITGSVVIHGPASLPYDIDLGPFPISDWYYEAADTIATQVMDPRTPFLPDQPGSPPASDNVLFAGKHVNAQGGGEYARVVLTPGKRHRLRLINPSVDNTFHVSLVGHKMTVIANDFVPVEAYTVDSLYMGVGQRYDVTIDASAPVANYWFNVTFSSVLSCGRSNMAYPAAIFSYEGAPSGQPKDKGVAPADSFCQDLTALKPIVKRDAPSSGFAKTADNSLSLSFESNTDQSRVYWKVNNTAIDVMWDEPTLEYISKSNHNFPTSYNLVSAPHKDQWSYWIVENTSPIPHPMHLHGHDFLILGQSPVLEDPTTGAPRPFTPQTDMGRLSFYNPTRRDTTMLPAFGWVALAFKTDNPGVWLFHCHIAWHVSQGLSVQFLERIDEIPSLMNLGGLEPTCADWTAYYGTDPNHKYDSGLRK